MKSIYKPLDTKTPAAFPYLGRYKFGDDRFTVLFTSPRSGVVVDDPTNVHGAGHACSAWNENFFERVTGTVELTFED